MASLKSCKDSSFATIQTDNSNRKKVAKPKVFLNG